jgi:tetratricopeptide (TPR) repeat protein
MISPRLAAAVLAVAGGLATARAATAEDWIREGTAAEARGDARQALEDFLQAGRLRPQDASVMEAISRQYSDLSDGMPTQKEKEEYARQALDYAQRAVAQQPGGSANVLAVAISYGKMALSGSPRQRLSYAKLIRDYAQRALALDPNNAWAHHVLGEWNSEVAAVDPPLRFFARMFFGGLPKGSFEEAIEHLRRATEIDPSEPAHWIELGFVYQKSGHADLARQAWEHGLALPGQTVYDREMEAKARKALNG